MLVCALSRPSEKFLSDEDREAGFQAGQSRRRRSDYQNEYFNPNWSWRESMAVPTDHTVIARPGTGDCAVRVSGEWRLRWLRPAGAREDLSHCTALFVQGCGDDANPLPRNMKSDSPEAVELAAMYGKILARSVDGVLHGEMVPLDGPLRTSYGIVQVQFQKPPSKEALQARLAIASGPKRRQIQYRLTKLEREGKLPEQHPYPIQVWRFGSRLSFIALTGESVVDYCLRFKKEYGRDVADQVRVLAKFQPLGSLHVALDAAEHNDVARLEAGLNLTECAREGERG